MLAMLAMLVKARAGLVVFGLFWLVLVVFGANSYSTYIYAQLLYMLALVPIINVKLCSAICGCD
jgi:uncharacterized membrane protein